MPGGGERAGGPPRRGRKDIEEYRDKRDFRRTPEPPPGEPAPRGPGSAFVVHRHEARRLHYDLRLEMEGVLKSWAVPRGFSYDPKDKRLAVRTEDHPLEYERFEGVIPERAYGAGTMTIWDRGRYRLVGETRDGPAALAAGKLEIALYGRRLRGEWHLVRTKPDKDEWLLFKARDRYARDESEPDPAFDVAAAPEAPFPERIDVMRPGAVVPPFSDPGWLFEVKLVGRRLLAAIRPEGVRLLTEDGTELGVRLEAIEVALGRIRAERAWLDGVLVALDETDRPSRERLEGRLAGEIDAPLAYYVFDLPYLESWDLRPLPLRERKAALSWTLRRGGPVLYVDHVAGRGEELYELTATAGLAGVIAKDAASPYVAGPSPLWKEIPVAAPRADAAGKPVLEALAGARPRLKHRIKFTRLDKVFWPEDGTTKGDLIAYYDRIAGFLLPYLRDRPVHMLRYPDGIEGKSFYQKDAPSHIPDWIETVSIDSDRRGEPIRYIVCNDRETLLYLVNLGSIDLHPWLSRRTSLDSPDWAVLDLDPDGSPFAHVVRVARAIGKVLRGIGLRPYAKTSGATGLHVYVPLREGYTYEHSVRFCEAIARYVADRHKDIATVERAVRRRGGKVYIDFLQNRRGQTVVPPYVVRPRPKAPVSTPLDWDELATELDPTTWTMKTIFDRLDKRGDLFAGTLHDRQDLLPAIEAFEKNYLSRERLRPPSADEGS